MSDSTMSKMIKLKSSDGKEFEVPETVLVKQSQTISRLIKEACTENSIPQVNVNVTAPVLEKVLEYCMKHVEAADASKTETTVKGCIKDDDLAAEEEECASIISGLKLSIKEKAEEEERSSITIMASKTETTGEGCIDSDKELRNWDKQFVDNDNAALYDLIMAANNLNIEGMLDLTCRKMADNVMGKSVEDIRQAFNIRDDDFIAEEEEN